jgi:predicted outer membrane protein
VPAPDAGGDTSLAGTACNLYKRRQFLLTGPSRQRHAQVKTFGQRMVQDHSKAAADAKDPDVKYFATHTLPTLRTHLQLARSTYDAIK